VKGIKADDSYIPLRTDPYAEHVEFPFAKGDLTANGVQYSTQVTTSDGNWTEVESVTIEPPIDGTIIEMQFSLTGRFQSSSTTKHVKFKWQARNKGGTWVDLHAEVTYAANASALKEYTYSGTFLPVANFQDVPFDVRLVIQRQDAGENAKGETKNSSWVKVKYSR
jgi:hypothetical protein